MVMDNSPIIDFYPPVFRTDLNGKQQEWEAVVLIPFIDEVFITSRHREFFLYIRTNNYLTLVKLTSNIF